MNAVFADAFYYIALLNAADRYHARAVALTRALDRPLVTTFWVLTETADALAAPAIRQIAHRFPERVADDPNTQVVPANSRWYERGLELFGKRPDKSWSLTDCISFVVMAEYGINDALTGDHHFSQAGFRALMLPESDT